MALRAVFGAASQAPAQGFTAGIHQGLPAAPRDVGGLKRGNVKSMLLPSFVWMQTLRFRLGISGAHTKPGV